MSVRILGIAAIALLLVSGCGSKKRESNAPRLTGNRDAGPTADDTGIPAIEADTGVPPSPSDAGGGFPDASTGPTDSGVPPPSDAGEDLCTEGPNKVHALRANVVNGTRSPTYVPLSPEQIMAVVGLTEGTPEDALCSGTLIHPRFVLTAQHCTEGVRAADMWVLFGPDDQNPDAAIAVLAKHEHPDHDMSILELAEDATTQVMVQPIYIPLFNLTNSDIGRTMEQAGYGQTETGNSDGRLFVAETLAGFEEAGDRNLVVDGMGVHGVCFGDSGGPSLTLAPEGDVRVMGALSWGDETCVGMDRYARSDWARAWIEQYTGPTPAAGPQTCGSTTETGACSNNNTRATYCANNELQSDNCPSGQVCGWSGVAAAGQGGWRCVAAASDPCGGIGYYGACNGDTLTWCDRGRIYERECATCGERCVELDPTFGYACQVDMCNGLDYLGQCNGNVAEWCNREGMIETENCAAMGQVCEYIDMEIGYYCADP